MLDTRQTLIIGRWTLVGWLSSAKYQIWAFCESMSFHFASYDAFIQHWGPRISFSFKGPLCGRQYIAWLWSVSQVPIAAAVVLKIPQLISSFCLESPELQRQSSACLPPNPRPFRLLEMWTSLSLTVIAGLHYASGSLIVVIAKNQWFGWHQNKYTMPMEHVCDKLRADGGAWVTAATIYTVFSCSFRCSQSNNSDISHVVNTAAPLLMALVNNANA